MTTVCVAKPVVGACGPPMATEGTGGAAYAPVVATRRAPPARSRAARLLLARDKVAMRVLQGQLVRSAIRTRARLTCSTSADALPVARSTKPRRRAGFVPYARVRRYR